MLKTVADHWVELTERQKSTVETVVDRGTWGTAMMSDWVRQLQALEARGLLRSNIPAEHQKDWREYCRQNQTSISFRPTPEARAFVENIVRCRRLARESARAADCHATAACAAESRRARLSEPQAHETVVSEIQELKAALDQLVRRLDSCTCRLSDMEEAAKRLAHLKQLVGELA